MATLATLVVSLVLDSAKFGDQLEKEVGRVAGIRKRLQSLGADMTKTGLKLTAGITTPIAGMGLAAVNAASDLEESINKVDVVFGDNARIINEWSQDAATALGQSQQQALEASGTFGNLFVSMGIGLDASTDMSMGLVQLASDLGSFNNLDPTIALEKLRSGLVGEVEPLRTLGVNLNQSMVQAKALEMGLAATTDELTPAILTQARYALILEQTTTAQGDFARTSDGLANSQKIVKAQLKDLAAAFGKELLPYAQKAVDFFRGLLERFQALDPSARKIIVVVLGIAAAIGPVLMILGVLTTTIGALLSPIGAVIAIVALLAAAWATNFGGIRDFLTQLWTETLQPFFVSVGQWLGVFIPQAIQFLSGLWTGVLLPAITAVWNFISKVLVPIFMAVAEVVGAVLGKAVEALAGLWQNVLEPALSAVWGWLSEKLMPIFQTIAEFLESTFGPVLQWLNDTIVQPLISGFGGIVSAVEKLVGWLKDLAEKIKNIKLPDWLTPGSPTPFEWGLRGIADAMRFLSRVELPRLESRLDGLSLANVSGINGAAAGAGGRGDTNFNFYDPVPVKNENDLTRRIQTVQMLSR